jgi:PKD repeat protein
VSFNASDSSDSDGSITSYSWSFGDGGSSSGVTAAHTYNSAGTYTAQLTVTDDDGATDTTTTQIEVSASSVPEDLYVDANSGSDTAGDGTQGNPYKTITKAVGVANAGGGATCTIHVAAGIYNAVLGEESPITLGQGIALMGKGSTREDVKIAVPLKCIADSFVENVQCYHGVQLHDRLSGAALLNVRISGPGGGEGVHVQSGDREIAVDNCLIEECTIGFYVGTQSPVKIRNCDIMACSNGIRCNGSSIAVVEVTGCSISTCDQGIYLYQATLTAHNSSLTDNHLHGIAVDGENSKVSVETTSITGGYAAVSLTDRTAGSVIDLGGGQLGSTGGNTFSGTQYDIYDERPSFSGPVYAKGNTWTDPQPSGTVNGPIDNPPNYRITNEGNSIIFSD